MSSVACLVLGLKKDGVGAVKSMGTGGSTSDFEATIEVSR